MSKLIDRAKSHYQRLVSEPKPIRVPEWDEDGEPVTIYATPLTLHERARLNRHAKDTMEMAAEVLILKAKDKAGEPVFTKEDKLEIMRNVDSGVIARVAKEIIGASDTELVEEAEKN